MTNPANVLEVKEDLSAAARALKLTIEPWEVRGQDDFDRVFAEMGKQRPDGLLRALGPAMRDNEKRIVGFALKSRLPALQRFPSPPATSTYRLANFPGETKPDVVVPSVGATPVALRNPQVSRFGTPATAPKHALVTHARR